MIFTQLGTRVQPFKAYYDDAGAYVAADCFDIDKEPGHSHKRFYRVDQLKADGGIVEIIQALEVCRSKEHIAAEDLPR